MCPPREPCRGPRGAADGACREASHDALKLNRDHCAPVPMRFLKLQRDRAELAGDYRRSTGELREPLRMTRGAAYRPGP